MRVETGQKRQIVAPRRGLVGFALGQNAISVGLQHCADRVQTLLRGSLASIGERNSVQGSHERICPLDVVSLVLEQCVVSVVMQFLHEAYKHVGGVIERTRRLHEYKGGSKGQALRFCAVLDRTEIE